MIQDGEILEIDSPTEIIQNYPKTIYNIKANNMYLLIKSLKEYKHQYSVYPFGEFVHYTDTRDDFNPEELQKYLTEKGLENITLAITPPTIEDTFMELAK